MKMWPWLRISLVVLCGLFAIAAGFVHWRSYRVSSVGHWYGEKSWLGIYCARGKIVVGIGREAVGAVIKHDFYERPVKAGRNDIPFDDSFHGGQWLGMGYYQSDLPKAGYVLVPIWVIWGMAGVPVLFTLLKLAKYKRRSRGNLCVNCGYDLRGGQEKCPECGEFVAKDGPFLANSH